MHRKIEEARMIADKVSELLQEPIFIFKANNKHYMFGTAEQIDNERRIYDTRYKVHSSDAELFRGIQDSSQKQRRKNTQSDKLRIKSDVLQLGTDNYSRWLSEVIGYYQGVYAEG